jgi:glyoxylase-like metal-dependent hydrolase (beta-lactamase superfamily II)
MENTITTPSTSFFCTKLNATTFLIIEDDSYSEQPHIYVKIYPQVIFISDTGCNSPRQKNKAITSLRHYLETFPAAANNNSPLNPDGLKPYLILCTHCHYDHILGIPSFISSSSPAATPRTTILASAHSKSFIQDDLPAHSLCKYMHIPTPSYPISHWATHLEYLSYTPPSPLPPQDPESPLPLRIQLLHIPGHTPDSLAWYDIDAHHLYIGDMFYARTRSRAFPSPFPVSGSTDELPSFTDASIIFPPEGSWIDYMSSLTLLLSFIQHRNLELERQWDAASSAEPGPEALKPRVLLGAGHVTACSDAETMTCEVRALFERIIAGRVPVRRSEVRRGEVFDYWCEEGDGEGETEAGYSVLAPRRLVEEVRRWRGEVEKGNGEGEERDCQVFGGGAY